MSTHNISISLRNKKKNIHLILDTLLSYSYKVLVLGQVNCNFLLVPREMGQVGQAKHGIF